MQYSKWGRTSELYNVSITFSDLKLNILPMKPTSLFAVFTTSVYWLLGFRSLVIITPKTLSLSTLLSVFHRVTCNFRYEVRGIYPS